MKISYNWLNDYVKVKEIDAKELADKVTKTGIAVEAVTKIVNGSNLVVGHVLECTNHPDSDHLHVCKVNLGDEITTIVCGAPNVDTNQKVIVAKVEATLPGDFIIKKASIRGIESNGMICALQELGVPESMVPDAYKKGIYVLDNSAIPGSDPLKYLEINDTIYDLDLNPNRNDCLSMLGFAYEVGAVTNQKVTMPEVSYPQDNFTTKEILELDVQTKNCLMYQAKLVKNVVIKESPEFIKNRLLAAGMRPINNVVDISNYIMLEYGQPLHFFDADKINNQIIVRMATPNEEVTTLDNQVRTLNEKDIVIANNKEILAIAGVMGGLTSEVTENTKNILIESAIFDPILVRYTSIKLGLRSESSLRFEKGLNPEYTSLAINRACYLLNKYASGSISNDIVIHDATSKESKQANVSLDKVNAVLGMTLTDNDIKDAFDRLGFSYIEDNSNYLVTIPNRRMDVAIAEDLIEEIGRLYGYDNIEGKMPITAIKKGSYAPRIAMQKEVSKRMQSLGLNSVKTYTLLSELEVKQYNNANLKTIKLELPMSSDKEYIRTSLLVSLLKVADYNLARQVKDINIFEISNTYYEDNNEYLEDNKLGILLLGNYLNNEWQQKKITVDFYLLKGIIENLLNYLGFNNRYQIKKGNANNLFHPGQYADIYLDNELIGSFGKIHPNLHEEEIFMGEISLDKLQNKKVRNLKYQEVPKYPEIVKDAAFIIPEEIESAEISKLIQKTGGSICKSVNVFDLYQGNNIEKGYKSLAFKITFQDLNKTLTDNEVNEIFNKIISEVSSKYFAKLRNS